MYQIAQKSTANQSSRGNYKPCLIVWHIADGTYNGTVTWEQNPASQVSSHFVLGQNGEVTQMVPLDKAAWTQGVVNRPTHPYVKAHNGVNPNLYCVSIECEGKWSETHGALTDKQLAAAAWLTCHIVEEIDRIYGVEIPIDREHMIGHYEINPVTRPHCPGEDFPFDQLIALARGEDAEPVQDETVSLPYTVQCGAFASAGNANALKDKLSARGYYCYLTNHLGTLRVCVGKFATQDEAAKTAADLNRKGFAGFVTTI